MLLHCSTAYYILGISVEAAVRVFLTEEFARFARKERIVPAVLHEAVRRAGRGLVDADLGGGLIKQRVARPGQGRSRSYRTIIAYRAGEKFSSCTSSPRASATTSTNRDLTIIKRTARVLMAMTDGEIERSLAAKQLTEI
jgi:hypothetical protein